MITKAKKIDITPRAVPRLCGTMGGCFLIGILMFFSVGSLAAGVTVYGVGNHSCGKYTADAAKDTPTFTYMYSSWVSGFISALGWAEGRPDLKSSDSDAMMGFITLYCANNPLDDLVDATVALSRELEK